MNIKCQIDTIAVLTVVKFFRKIWKSGQNDEMRKFGQVQPYTNQNMYKYVVPPGHYEISCR